MTEILHCSICRNPVDFYDKVHLDFLNTITHQYCETKMEIKDFGTFIEIINKYPFFKKSFVTPN
ncbi:hypothetical protein [Ornithinibacillus sp. JPR2-1]|uniref:hypothetical protein n=1 Tax=Ornithinibacillus sp. JPR2-1 TaxID=2094019 RepID=UPI0031D249FD